jgi:hypothetical protein
MRTPSGTAALPFWLLGLCACASVVDSTPQNPVVFHYQHVANAHEIHFSSPVTVVHRQLPVEFVAPRDTGGFWAIFVLCSIDTREMVLPAFRYDVNNFEVRYRTHASGALQPFSLRYEGSADLNRPADAHAIVAAIGAEIAAGPPARIFARGHYAPLNYRFAVYVPRSLPDYTGGQLALAYKTQPAIAVGNGHPPSDLPVVGGNGAGIAARCLP